MKKIIIFFVLYDCTIVNINILFSGMKNIVKNLSQGNNLLKTVIKLAIPISLQQMLAASFHLVDTAFIVRLGVIPTAALGVSGRWFFLINLTFFGFASGMSVIVSQFWGINDVKTIRKSFGLGLMNAFFMALVASIALFFFTPQLLGVFTNDQTVIAEGVKYMKIACWSFIPLSISFIFGFLLRSTETVILPLILTIISVATNTALNFLLIFGNWGFPKMGIRGAALATLISGVIQLVLVVSVSYIKKNIAAAKIKELFSFGENFVKKYYVLALPVLANEILWAMGVSVYNMVLGRLGSENYAAFTIYGSIEQLAFTFFVGVCSACAVIVGKMVGKGELNEAYTTGKKFIIYGTLFSFIIGIITLLVRQPIISLLGVPDEYTAKMVSRLLFIYAFAIPLYILPYIAIVGVFRAGGNTKVGLVFDIINVWFIGVPLVVITGCVLKWSFEAVFIAMWTEHIIKTIMCLIYFKSRKWIRRVTDVDMIEG